MNDIDYSSLIGRRAICPLCKRGDLQISLIGGKAVIDPHPMVNFVETFPVPYDCEASLHGLKLAVVQCPMSFAPIWPAERK